MFMLRAAARYATGAENYGGAVSLKTRFRAGGDSVPPFSRLHGREKPPVRRDAAELLLLPGDVRRHNENRRRVIRRRSPSRAAMIDSRLSAPVSIDHET